MQHPDEIWMERRTIDGVRTVRIGSHDRTYDYEVRRKPYSMWQAEEYLRLYPWKRKVVNTLHRELELTLPEAVDVENRFFEESVEAEVQARMAS